MRARKIVLWSVTFVSLAVCLSTTGTARAGIIDPGTPVAGVSQAVWGDRWWQWAISFPNGASPITDPTGALSSLGDQGEVFFLAGTISGPANRVATVREGQTLLLPIEFVVSPIPLFGNSEAEVRADAAATIGEASDLFVTIDGSPAPLPPTTSSLLDFYQTTPPGTFPLTIPDDNIFGAPVGTFDSVAVGYWVMLEGLSVGVHTLHFGGHFEGTPSLGYPPIDTDITYTVTVVPAAVPEPTTILLVGMGGLFLIGLGWKQKSG